MQRTPQYAFNISSGGVPGAPLNFQLPLDADHPTVPLESEIVVRFSEGVAGDVNVVQLLEEDATSGALTPVGVAAFLEQQGTVARLRPLESLMADGRYQLQIGTGLADSDGRDLADAPITQTISVVGVSEPVVADIGQIEASPPDEDGNVQIEAGVGTVAPDNIVIVLNQNTGATSIATVNADGSFSASVVAGLDDDIAIIVRDAFGNDTMVTIDSFVERDPNTGEVLSAFIGRSGGVVASGDDLRLIVPQGAVNVRTQITIERLTEPFVLPADLIADSEVVAAFNAEFGVAERIRITADVPDFSMPLDIELDAPLGAQAGDVYLVVSETNVVAGGSLADLDQNLGVRSDETEVTRLQIVESASAKSVDGALVLSTDSPPFHGILEPGDYTLLSATSVPTFFAGEVRRDTVDGNPVPNAPVQTIEEDPTAQVFTATADENGEFVIQVHDVSSFSADGAVLASRLDVRDERFDRVVRRDVRGEIGPPSPPSVQVAYLTEPFVLPLRIPSDIIAQLGDLEPPFVTIEASPAPNNFVTINEPLTIRIVADDNDQVTFVGLEIDSGDGLEAVPLDDEGAAIFTPEGFGILQLRARAIDPTSNETFVDLFLSVVDDANNPAAIEDCPPAIITDPPPSLIPFDEAICAGFSAPLDPGTVGPESIRVVESDGTIVDTRYLLENNNTRVCLVPRRMLRFNQTYRFEVLPDSLQNDCGISLPPFVGSSSTPFRCPAPELLFSKEISRVSDVALAGETILVTSQADGSSVGDNGTLHTILLQQSEEGEIEEAWSTQTETNGGPLSLAVDGNQAYVGNRFLGPIPIVESIPAFFNPVTAAGSPVDATPDQTFSCQTSSIDPFNPFGEICLGVNYDFAVLPQPPSNLQVFDISDPQVPVSNGATPMSFTGPPDQAWDPATWPDRVEVTGAGVAVMNFLDTVELFEGTESVGLFGYVPRFTDTQLISPGPDLEFGTEDDSQSEFKDVSYVESAIRRNGTDDTIQTAVAIEDGGLRTFEIERQEVRDRERIQTLDYEEDTSYVNARIGTLDNFQIEVADDEFEEVDLAFASLRTGRLRLLDVTNPYDVRVLSEIDFPFGNMSFDQCRGVGYLHGDGGEFRVVDFNDPENPVDIAEPITGDDASFQITGSSRLTNFNGIANREGVVYTATDSGIAVVDAHGGCRECATSKDSEISPPLASVESAGVDLTTASSLNSTAREFLGELPRIVRRASRQFFSSRSACQGVFLKADNSVIRPSREALSISNFVSNLPPNGFSEELPQDTGVLGFDERSDDPENFRLEIIDDRVGTNTVDVSLCVNSLGNSCASNPSNEIVYQAHRKPGTNRFRTKFLRLVADQADVAGDQTVLAALGDTVQAIYRSPGRRPLVSVIPVGQPNSPDNKSLNQSRHGIMEVPLRVVVFEWSSNGQPQNSLSSTGSQIDADVIVQELVEKVDERFAQIGVRVRRPVIPDFLPLPGHFLTTVPQGSFEGPVDWMISPKSVADQAALIALRSGPPDIDVFFVPNMYLPHRSRNPSVLPGVAMTPSGRTLSNNAQIADSVHYLVIDGSRFSPSASVPRAYENVIAHELMHVLLDMPFHRSERLSLLEPGDSDVPVLQRKRIGPFKVDQSADDGGLDTFRMRSCLETLGASGALCLEAELRPRLFR